MYIKIRLLSYAAGVPCTLDVTVRRQWHSLICSPPQAAKPSIVCSCERATFNLLLVFESAWSDSENQVSVDLVDASRPLAFPLVITGRSTSIVGEATHTTNCGSSVAARKRR